MARSAVQLYWSAWVPCNAGRDISDPLGFRAAANQVARRLVPGLTQRTERARGFSLVSLGLDLASRSDLDPNEAFLRFERLWVSARVLSDPSTRMDGKRLALAYLRMPGDTLSLTKPILTQGLASGLWGRYRVASEGFALLKSDSSRRTGPRFTSLQARGRNLAAKLRNAVCEPGLLKILNRGEVDRDDLLELAGRIDRVGGDDATPDEIRVLDEAIRAEQGEHQSLAQLRAVFDALPRRRGPSCFALEGLPGRTELTEDQRAAAAAGLAVRRLMLALEAPFRAWATGARDGTFAGVSMGLEQDWTEVLQFVAGTARTDLARLRDALRQAPTLETVQRHHDWLALQRGSRRWVRGEVDPERETYQEPDFCLGAVSSLFCDGVLGNGGGA